MDLRMIRSKVITVEDMENIQYLSEFKLTEKAYMDYTATTKWNGNVDYDLAKSKIIRNLMLSREANEEKIDKSMRLFYYGNLSIGLNMITKTIHFVRNTLNTNYEFEVDKERRKVLNYVIGIEEGK